MNVLGLDYLSHQGNVQDDLAWFIDLCSTGG